MYAVIVDGRDTESRFPSKNEAWKAVADYIQNFPDREVSEFEVKAIS